MVLVPLWSLSSLVPPSLVLTSIQPCAWLDTSTKCGGELKSTILPLSPTQAPSPWIWLFQSDDSPDTQGHCHHYHCAPEQEMLQQSWAASSMGLKLRTFCRQRTLLQPPCPHAMTTGTLTCWCCCFRHGQTLKLCLYGTAHLIHIITPITGQAQY